MTKTILVLVLTLGFLSSYAQRPEWSISTSLGIDLGGVIPIPLSEVPDDSEGTPKLKPTLGAALQKNFSDRWSMGFEVNYHSLAIEAFANVVSQAFWADDRSYATYFSGEAYSDVELHFVEFPLAAYYHFNDKWSLVFGAYYSHVFNAKLETEGRNGWISADKEDTDNAPLPGTQNTSFDFNDELDNFDIGALLGYQFLIGERVQLWGRFHVGFKSIFIPEFQNIDYEMYQFRFSTGVSFILWQDA